MKEVTKDEFFAAVKASGDADGDPMPTHDCITWRCQKTRAIFGKTEPNPRCYEKDQPLSIYFLADGRVA